MKKLAYGQSILLGGFDHHLDLASGDDDLFVQDAAAQGLACWPVLLSKASAACPTQPAASSGDAFRRKRRHLTTAARYGRAVDALLTRMPDAILLQELSQKFFDRAVNPRAPDLLAVYEVTHTTNTAGPGTAVLLRRGGALAPNAGAVVSAGASEELTGGASKSASGVLCTCGGARVWLLSIHMTPTKYKPTAARTHLGILSDALRAELSASVGSSSAPRVVLGGDLNAEPHEVATLQREGALLGMLGRVTPPGHTGLSANFAQPETIDHVFLSPGLRVVDVALERPPGSPFGVPAAEGQPAPVVGASDHVWQSVTVALE